VLEFIARPARPRTKLKLFEVQITNKSWKEIRLPKQLLIANKKMRIYSSASIAASLSLKNIFKEQIPLCLRMILWAWVTPSTLGSKNHSNP
jgi:hypothetical protein